MPEFTRRPTSAPGTALLGLGLTAALMTGACSGSDTLPRAGKTAAIPSASSTCLKPQDGTGCLPLAPENQRIDLTTPRFSHPLAVTNPLHPSAKTDQVIYGGQVDGRPWRTEFTRLPTAKTITWNGQQVKTVVMQYLALSDGRIDEVALDWFAQADDGSVWYFGEDVFNYDDGVLTDTDGTWLAGRDGPPAMIMPAKPRVGDVYRPENAPGKVFEEVTVKATGQTVAGPGGPVQGAFTAGELHMDGTREDKVFAPGYGEFSTGNPAGDQEAVTLAVPIDARPGPLPPRLTALSRQVHATFEAVGTNDWDTAATAITALKKAWHAYQATGVPEPLGKQMSRDVDLLATAVTKHQTTQAHQAALRVAQNDLDLRLRHRPVAEIDRARLALWARQLQVDLAAKDTGAVAGDVTTLEWTTDRVRHTLDPATAGRLDAQLSRLRKAVDHRDLAAVAKAAQPPRL